MITTEENRKSAIESLGKAEGWVLIALKRHDNDNMGCCVSTYIKGEDQHRSALKSLIVALQELVK